MNSKFQLRSNYHKDQTSLPACALPAFQKGVREGVSWLCALLVCQAQKQIGLQPWVMPFLLLVLCRNSLPLHNKGRINDLLDSPAEKTFSWVPPFSLMCFLGGCVGGSSLSTWVEVFWAGESFLVTCARSMQARVG